MSRLGSAGARNVTLLCVLLLLTGCSLLPHPRRFAASTIPGTPPKGGPAIEFFPMDAPTQIAVSPDAKFVAVAGTQKLALYMRGSAGTDPQLRPYGTVSYQERGVGGSPIDIGFEAFSDQVSYREFAGDQVLSMGVGAGHVRQTYRWLPTPDQQILRATPDGTRVIISGAFDPQRPQYDIGGQLRLCGSSGHVLWKSAPTPFINQLSSSQLDLNATANIFAFISDSAGPSHTLEIRSLRDGSLLRTIFLAENCPYVRFSPQGNQIACNESVHGTRIFDVKTGGAIAFLPDAQEAVFDDNCNVLYLITGVRAVRVPGEKFAHAVNRIEYRDMKTNTITRIDELEFANHLAITPDGKYIGATGEGGGYIYRNPAIPKI